MLEKLFGFNKNETNVRTEIFAGLTTFLTMAYILAVNPNILGETGMDREALFTTTVLMSFFATALMALYGKLPLALAPGMGLNAFFAYTICLTLGFTWQFALTAVLLEGIIFIILTVTNLRKMIMNILPETIKKSIGVGIGLYIAFIGLKNAGVIVGNSATLVSLGDVTSGSGLLALIGIIITSALLIRNVKGALFFGIIATTLIGIPMGETKFNGVFSTPPSIGPIFWKFDWASIFTKEMAYVVFTMLFVDLFGCMGTIIGVTNQMKNDEGKFPRLKKAFMVDAISTTVGAMFGTSAVSTYVESASGINAGGRSGLTSMATALCFLASLFLAPVFLAIPSAAVAPVLVLVGLMMMSAIIELDFNDYTESIPAFMCIVMMPLTYSIAEGIILGLLSYVFINALSGNLKKVSAGMYILAALFILKYVM
ncbi:MAG: NCS2 family permease [Bacteroidales bacterium]|nr:NCS2 family permease [Bacteroidales bacterium]